jgi:RNA polymerase sigma-70 factor (ECF subfamily)
MAAARLEGNEATDAWSLETESESVAVVRTALQSIPAPQRQVVLLSYYHDLTWQEIANTLGIPLGTVKSRMHGALTRLRGLLVTEKDGEIR